MSNTRIPSPARSLGGHRTPRRYIKRGTRSVGSPARSNTSGRLTSMINMNMQPATLSPLPNRRSVLSDSTYIQEPRRKSWWRDIDDNSGDVLEVLESVTAGNTDNAIDELIDMEVLSQEKHDPVDLPESSDSESINSIVLPQRNLFTQKEVQAKKKFVQLIGNRESLAKLNKNSCGDDKTVIASTKTLFQNRKQRTKPAFPAALLSASPNKTTDDILKETNTGLPKNQVRNIFNVHRPTKRKNMFAEFIITESDNEITEIEPKIFEFKKKSDITHQLQKQLTTSSITADIEMEDWTHLPSSTMVDKQIEEEIAITPQKKCRLSKLSEAKESEVGTMTQPNKSLKNVSINSLNNKETTLSNKQAVTKKNSSIMINNITSNHSFEEIRKNASTTHIKSQHISMRNVSTDKIKEAYKSNNQIIEKTTTELIKNTINDINMEGQYEQPIIGNTEDQSKNVEPEDEADDHNFTLEYDNDDEHSPVGPDESYEMSNMCMTKKATSSQLETGKLINLENNVVLKGPLDLNGDSNNIEQSKQESVNNVQAQIQGEQSKESRNISECNLRNTNEPLNNTVQKESEQDCINGEESKTQTKQSEEDHNVSDYKLVNSQEAKNNSAQHSHTHEAQNTPIDEEADKNHEDKENENSDSIKNSLQEQNEGDEVEVNKYAQDDDDIAQEPDEDEYDVQEHEEDVNDNSDNENQYSDDDHEVEQASEDDNENEESEDVIDNIETSNDNKNQYNNEDQEVEQASEEEEREDVNDNMENSVDNENQYDKKDQEVEQGSENDSEKEESEDVNDNMENSIDNENQYNNEDQEVEQASEEEEREDANDNMENSVDNENQYDNKDQEVEQESENDSEKEESEDVNDNMENSIDNENQYNNEDQEVEQGSENDSEKEESEDVIDNIETSNDNENQYNNKDQEVEQASEEEESGDVIDNIGTSNNDINSPEVILHDRTNQMNSLIEGQPSTRKTKSTMLKSLHIRRSMATVQDVTGFSDGARSSSAENSFWDSHRTTRKTIRKTLGRDVSPRKSLRTLVMERSAKRQTTQMETHWDTAKFPQANSTEFPETSNQDFDMEEPVEQSEHEISKRTRQATLEMCFQKIKQKSLEQRLKIEETVKQSLKTTPADNNLFKVPKKPTFWNEGPKKPIVNKPRQKKSLIPLDDLPPEVLEDLKYKPPKRFQPRNASWITARLYKYLENKLEAKYDYKARVRAEQLVATIYDFTKNLKRHEVAPTSSVQVLKHEMARLNIVKTHFEFYNFFHMFMPRDIRVKVIPDIVNRISLPKDGIYSNIING